MNSVEVRKSFLAFYKKKGHFIDSSAPMVLKDDPTLMFTNAEKDKSERSEEDELFTVGGLVYSKINRIPDKNEIIKTDDNLEIKILKSNNRKIETVEIKKIN